MRVWGAVLILALAACSSSEPAAVTPQRSAVAKVVTGGNPCGVAEAAGSVWVSDAADGRLLRIDPASKQVTVTDRLDPTPCEMVLAFGSLWVTTQSGKLDKVDPRTGKVIARITVGQKSYEAEATSDALWVSDRSSGQITIVDPGTTKTSVLPLPGRNPGGMVFAGGAMWVGDDLSGSTHVLRIDPVTRAVTTVPVGHRPAYVTATTDAVWVSELGDSVGSIVRIDAAKVAVRETVEAQGKGPAVVAPVGTQIWATLFEAGEVWAITPA